MFIGDSEKAQDYIYTLSLERATKPYTRCSYQRVTHSEAPLASILQEHHLLFCVPTENIQAYLDTPLQSTREIVVRVTLEERSHVPAGDRAGEETSSVGVAVNSGQTATADPSRSPL